MRCWVNFKVKRPAYISLFWYSLILIRT